MSSSETAILVAGLGATLQLFRLSSDLIAEASQKDAKATASIEKVTPSQLRASALKNKQQGNSKHSTGSNNNSTDLSEPEEIAGNTERSLSAQEAFVIRVSHFLHLTLLAYFLIVTGLTAAGSIDDEVVYDTGPCSCAASALFLSFWVNIRDKKRAKFNQFQRTLHVLSGLILLLGVLFRVFSSSSASSLDYTSVGLLGLFAGLVLLESRVIEWPDVASKDKKARLSMKSFLIVLKPYFWPDATATSATSNRIRAISTWAFVVASKACSLVAPIYIGRASTDLTRGNWDECIRNVIWFALLTLASSVFKEAQSLVYLKVAEVAFVQLAEISFAHLHELSLDWHFKKKLGEVLRSMSRGITACDTLVKYLFLWLVPAIAECILVAVIFSLYFDELLLAVTVFFFVFAYMLMTVLLTLWRKKFRKQVAKSDNQWNDVATDSLINFETVKYFTAEEQEKEKFAAAVSAYQQGNVNVAASLSALNTAQKVLLQGCLISSLCIVVLSIRDRSRCCEVSGCESTDFECCDELSPPCPGMQVGDFVAVLQYTVQLFTPLNFLGSIYNAIVMAIVDLTNLSELLAEDADIKDTKDALEVPESYESDTVVEFDNVKFNYPSQPEDTGLKGVSFKMKRGTTTAIVGSTGAFVCRAGKTTISRLLFRFYDVTGGAVKVNGVDVRMLKQKSLRDRIGVVPQAATLFNDTLGTNIAYGKKDATEAEVQAVLDAAQLTHFVESLPGKFLADNFVDVWLTATYLTPRYSSQRDWTLWSATAV
eukprot:scaffold9441_cov167-Amphora_coffeaeformis.AAC.8